MSRQERISTTNLLVGPNYSLSSSFTTLLTYSYTLGYFLVALSLFRACARAIASTIVITNQLKQILLFTQCVATKTLNIGRSSCVRIILHLNTLDDVSRLYSFSVKNDLTVFRDHLKRQYPRQTKTLTRFFIAISFAVNKYILDFTKCNRRLKRKTGPKNSRRS